MSLDHMLIGMLAEPATGYDLKRFFGQTMRHFWDAELSQIYPALRRLEREGLLESWSEPPKRGPARRVYARTPAGAAALGKWLTAEPEVGQPRLAFLGQLLFHFELDDPRRTLSFLDGLRRAFAERLESLRRVEATWVESEPGFPDDLPSDGFHGHLTLRAGVYRMEAMLAWCDESIDRVTRRLARDTNRRDENQRENEAATAIGTGDTE